MQKLSLIFISLLSSFSPAFGAQSKSAEESAYFKTFEQMKSVGQVSIEANSPEELPTIILALDEMSFEKDLNLRRNLQQAARLLSEKAPLGEALQLYTIYRQAGGAADALWESKLQELFFATKSNQLDKAIYTIQNNLEVFKAQSWSQVKAWIQEHSSSQLQALSVNPVDAQMLRDLVQVEPAFDQFQSGNYKNFPRVYMFCRSVRPYPCLMIMKNADGSIHLLADGKTPWSQPSLGYSHHQQDYSHPNGDTPSGIMLIDGPMPVADQQLVFGKYRRLILNFVGKSDEEKDIKSLLPPTSQTATWWQQSIVARDLGRGLLRIHGTGLPAWSGPSFPLVPTSGCVAKRENTYSGITYKDQRLFLDELMKAQGLVPSDENELKIRGLLYIINIDDQKKPVSIDDLRKIGIL